MNHYKRPDDNVCIAETYKVSGCVYFVKKDVNCHVKRQSSPITGLEWPRGFQEVKVPRFHDNTGWW